ncbi:MAG TPA: hemolysin family protein [Stellaceae bacterium]|nr:hemolysin family protein [Stellaceae bacterium]
MLSLQLSVVLLLIVLNGLFAMAEAAMLASRQARLQHAADSGRRGARAALELAREPGRFLSTVQIGITVISVLASAVGSVTLGDRLASELERVPGFVGEYAHALSIGAVVVGISYVSLVLGELVPKRIALSRPEAIAAGFARFMRGFAAALGPLEWILSASTNLVLGLTRIKPDREGVTEEEITVMLREGTAAGRFHAVETSIVQMAFRLGDRRVAGMMTPRTQVEWLDLTDAVEEQKRRVAVSDYSRFPVVEGNTAHVLGVVQVKDILGQVLGDKPFDVRAIVRRPLYIPNTLTALRALEILKKSGEPMALVVDEYGAFEGVVTLHDILQALVGDIAEPGGPAEDAPVVKRQDGSWLVDGMVPIDEVKDLTGLSTLPGEDTGEFHTLGGFLMAQMNRIPSVADHIMLEGFRFEVMDMDGRRVDRVLIVPPKRHRARAEAKS